MGSVRDRGSKAVSCLREAAVAMAMAVAMAVAMPGERAKLESGDEGTLGCY